jgi:hypothetical protein
MFGFEICYRMASATFVAAVDTLDTVSFSINTTTTTTTTTKTHYISNRIQIFFTNNELFQSLWN